MKMTSCHNFYTFTQIVMLIKLFVRNGEVFLGKLFQKKAKANAPCLFAERQRSLWISNIHNWMEQKVLNLKLFMRRILMPRVINKVHISPQFEYIIWLIDWYVICHFYVSHRNEIVFHTSTSYNFSALYKYIELNSMKCIQILKHKYSSKVI